tara:strand:- start:537 stop:1085 length:549 start_codon:yes stop_codon:yes gene_type:complete
MIKKIIIILIILNIATIVNASTKDNIIINLKKIKNISFNFKQTVDDKMEEGNCTIQYPKKIYCSYNNFKKKIIVSNGKSLVIKNQTTNQSFIYPLKKTPLNLLLDKDFLLSEIINSEEKIVNDKYYNFSLKNKDHKINIFFDKDSNELVGWQTEDLYQNLAVTYIYNIKKNSKIDKKIFRLP